jgi:hypothetical protein
VIETPGPPRIEIRMNIPTLRFRVFGTFLTWTKEQACLTNQKSPEDNKKWESRVISKLETISRMLPRTLRIVVKAEKLDPIIKVVERILPNRCTFCGLKADHRYFIFQ